MSEARTSTTQLAALALAAALVPLNSTMVAVALPAISLDLGVTVAELTQWLVTSYLLVGIVCQSPAGKLGDLWGHRRALALGQATFAVGALLGLFSRGLAPLTGARVLMAAGGAIMAPSAMALLRTELPPERRARAFGLFGSVMGSSAAIGPMVGGLLSTRFGWPAIFAANVPPLALSLILARGAKPVPLATGRRPVFDVLGSLLIGAALALLVAGLRVSGPRGVAMLVASAVSLVLFVAWERRAADPVVDLRLFRERAFSAGAAVISLQNLAMYALLFELPVFTARVLGADPSVTGRTLLTMMAAMVLASPLGGRAAERFGSRAVAMVGSAMACAGATALAVGSIATPTDAIAPLVSLGFGLGLSTAPSQAAALSAVAAEKSGMASAMMSTMRYLGAVVGVAALGLVLVPGGDLATQHRVACCIFAVSLALACLASAFLPGHVHGHARVA